MSKLPSPRDLVLNKDTSVSNGIKGHQHRKKNQPITDRELETAIALTGLKVIKFEQRLEMYRML